MQLMVTMMTDMMATISLVSWHYAFVDAELGCSRNRTCQPQRSSRHWKELAAAKKALLTEALKTELADRVDQRSIALNAQSLCRWHRVTFTLLDILFIWHHVLTTTRSIARCFTSARRRSLKQQRPRGSTVM